MNKIRITYCASPGCAVVLTVPLLFLGGAVTFIFTGLDSDFRLLALVFAAGGAGALGMWWSKFLQRRNRKEGDVVLDGSLLKTPEEEWDLAGGRSFLLQTGSSGTLVLLKMFGRDPVPVIYLKGIDETALLECFPMAHYLIPLERDFKPDVTLTVDAADGTHREFGEELLEMLWEKRDACPLYREIENLPFREKKQPDTGSPVSVSLDSREGDPVEALRRSAGSGVSGDRGRPAEFIGSLISRRLVDLDGLVFVAENHVILNQEDPDRRKHRLFTAIPLDRNNVSAGRKNVTFATGGSGIGASHGSYTLLRFTVNVATLPGEKGEFYVDFSGRNVDYVNVTGDDPFDDRLDAAIAYINNY